MNEAAGQRKARIPPRGTVRTVRSVLALVALVLLLAGVQALPVTAASTDHPSFYGAPPGTIGFITSDGKFFIQVGATTFNVFTAVPNGSEIYAYAVTVNITSIVPVNATAYVQVFYYPQERYIYQQFVPMSGYGITLVYPVLPDHHTWQAIAVTVDGTTGVYYTQTPYDFLSIPNVPDGGFDLEAFIVVAEVLAIGLPLMFKAERMTKRAIFAPKWNATIWLHGIMIGMIAWYFTNFPTINQFFMGWEWAFIPIPEMLFLFIWSSGRHSRNRTAQFQQAVPRVNQPMGFIIKKFYIGRDNDGDLVLIKFRSRSPIQWWYRSRGHHVKAFIRRKDGSMEPMGYPVVDHDQLTPEQIRDPTRFPRGGRHDPHNDFPVLNPKDEDGDDVDTIYFVPRISTFQVTWPHASFHREVKVEAYDDPKTGQHHEAGKRSKLTWPHIVDGKAEVTLASWHYQDVLYVANGWMATEDLVTECDDLAVQLWTERGFRATETSRKADERVTSHLDIRSRPLSDLSPEDLQAAVPPRRLDRRSRPALPGGEEGSGT